MEMSQRLEQILGDEAAMAQIRQLAQSLGGSGGEGGGLDIGGLLSALGGGGGNAGSNGSSGGVALPPAGPQPNQGDANVQLLRALKPFLSQKRRHRVGQAVRMMQMMEMLPLLQQSGMLSGLMGGDEDD